MEEWMEKNVTIKKIIEGDFVRVNKENAWYWNIEDLEEAYENLDFGIREYFEI
jgi:hypothetical protein